VGVGVCALLTAWMVPDTTPHGQPSPLAGMTATAEAQKPSVSAVPDSAIPAWAGSLQQAPSAAPAASPAPAQVADSAPQQPQTMEIAAADPPQPSPDMDQAPPPDAAPAAQMAPPPPPRPMAEDYQARRAQWQARLDATMAGQRGPGGGL
jgi:hypothetical protein